MAIPFQKVHHLAKIPEYKTPGSAGFDLYAVEDVDLPPFDSTVYIDVAAADYDGLPLGGVTPVIVPLGFKTAIPPGWQIAIRSRSGMAAKGIVVLNSPGTIDSDYRGEWGVILGNLNGVTVKVKAGDRIAQGVIEPTSTAIFEETDELDETDRGDGSYGSTGKQ